MTVRQLARELSSIKEELQDKEVKIVYQNGVVGSFSIKFVPKERFNLDKTNENIDFIILN